ncbi:MAG: T9SS type A sorting domain-containing protein [Bacteroidetes bacterium]|nr:T9SS type A sorting domain-containing protein [Bacteroidota bacterium]
MRKKFTFLTSAILTATAFAQQGIHIQDNVLNDVFVLNKDSVYVTCSNVGSGNFKRMALVNPATKEWKYLNSTDYTGYFGTFVMKNAQKGVMAESQSGGAVYTTNDGWQTRQTSTASGFNMLVGSTAGYAAYVSATYHVFFSTDGANWTDEGSLGSPGSQGNVLRSYGNTVIMFRQLTTSYKSTDGGQTYSTLTFTPNFTGTFVDFQMLSQDTFLVGTYNALWKSVDAGLTWTSQAMPVPAAGYHLQGMFAKNSQEVFVWSNNKDCYYSNNSGATWQVKARVNGYQFFAINNTVYSFPEASTTDNGTTWNYFLPSAQSTYDKGNDVHFRGNQGISASTAGRVFYSADKGRSWSMADTMATYDINGVKILGNGDYMAVDSRSQVFYSTNQGLTWTQKYTNNSSLPTYKILESANSNTLLIANSNYPVVSTDHGNTWTPVAISGGSHTQCLSPSGDIYDAFGWFSYVTFTVKGWQINRMTPAGAVTVVDTFLANNETLIDIEMTGNTTGYLFVTDASKNMKVYKSTNSFASGSTQLVATVPPVVAGTADYARGAIRIQHFGADTLYLIGNGNKFYHYTTNGGSTWNVVNQPFTATYPMLYPSLHKGYFFNPNEYLFTLNNNGGIYLNVNGATGSQPTGIEVYQASAQAGDMKLYPNPAGDELTILTDKKAERILIFDMLGHSVYDGTETQIHTGQFGNGIYIVKVLGEHGYTMAQQKLVVSH